MATGKSLVVISVLTTPKRQEYLADTLRSIDAAGALSLTDKTVFVDGDARSVMQNVSPGWQVLSLHKANAMRGTRASLWQILHYAALLEKPFLLHFEDDVRLCLNAIPVMMAVNGPIESGFTSFFQQNPGMPNTPGFHYLPSGQKWWGCQAFKIPYHTLSKFVDPRSAPVVRPMEMQCDVWLGSQLRPCVLLPTLVRHVGLHTTIPTQKHETLSGESAHRAGMHYVGDNFDATKHPLCPPLSARETFGE